jgi:hypothetical protein
MDLSVELLPIGGYLKRREEMVKHLFRSISTKKLHAMLPEILKVINMQNPLMNMHKSQWRPLPWQQFMPLSNCKCP